MACKIGGPRYPYAVLLGLAFLLLLLGAGTPALAAPVVAPAPSTVAYSSNGAGNGAGSDAAALSSPLAVGLSTPADASAAADDADADQARPQSQAAPCFSMLRPQSLPARDALGSEPPSENASLPLPLAGPWAEPPGAVAISDPDLGLSPLLPDAHPSGLRRLGRCDLHWPDRLQPTPAKHKAPDAALAHGAALREAKSAGSQGAPRLLPVTQDEPLLLTARLRLAPPRSTERLLLPPPLSWSPQHQPEPTSPPPR